MKKLLSLIAAFGVMFYLSSCGDDDEDPDLAAPTVTAPAATTAQVGNDITLTFNYTAAAGFTSAAITTQTGGTAAIATNGTAGETEGTITVTFTAGATAGAGSVELTVTDAEGDTGNATAVITVSTSPVPTIEGIPAAATITEGTTLTVPGPITLTAVDGFAATNAFTLSIDGAAAADLGVAGTATSPVSLTDVDLPTADLAPGTYSFVFTLTDGDGDAVSFTHTLTVQEFVETFTITALSDTENEVTGTINRDFTFTNDRIWILVGRVIVGSGATLTIDEGTIIKGAQGQESSSSVLLVSRGADIMANGTAQDPIVFTSALDGIGIGEFESTLDLSLDLGLWGGVLILGNAPISADADEVQIEGIPVSVTEGLYGGNQPEDNSGVFRYVSIRFTGTQLGPGNELQGLTLGGVGSETVIDHVESINSADDGIEIFGGTVNVTNFIVWGQDDDGYDIDQGWSGTIDNFVFIGRRGDHPMEIDGPEGSANGMGTLRNGSLRGVTGADEDEFADLRDGAQIGLDNLYFFDFPEGADLELDADGADDPASPDPSDPNSLSNNPDNSDNYVDDLITLTNLKFLQTPNDGGANFTLAGLFIDRFNQNPADEDFRPNDSRTQTEIDNQTAANEAKFIGATGNEVVASQPANFGADVSVFGWSLAASEGALDGF